MASLTEVLLHCRDFEPEKTFDFLDTLRLDDKTLQDIISAKYLTDQTAINQAYKRYGLRIISQNYERIIAI